MKKNILFDLDGTLVDPRQGILNSIHHALDRMGLEEKRPDELLSFIGPPLRDSFKERYRLSDARADQAVDFYREYYSGRGLHENVLYPGIPELLKDLQQAGRDLFMATSKPTVFAEKIIKGFGLQDLFSEIVGSNLDNSRAVKKEIIGHILATHGLQAADCVMIGDRYFDIVGAKAHGMEVIALGYGYGSRAEFLEYGADHIAEDLEALRALLL